MNENHLMYLDGNAFSDSYRVEFTQLISDYKVVNLGQGFPDFGPPSFMQEAYCNAICGGASMHQYTRAFSYYGEEQCVLQGYPRLVKIIAKFFGRIMGREIDPMEEVLITVGAYHALFCTFQALVDEGDEVIIVEPFFDCYEPMVMMAGGTPVYIPLKPKEVTGSALSSADWLLCPEEVASKFNPRTKAIVINTPNNPLGKVGWAMCSGHILKHLKTFHQNSVYHCPTAPQEAVAVGFQREYDVFGTEESYFRQLPAQLHAKRLKLAKSLRSVGLQPILPQGGYFMTTDISSLKVELNDPDTKDEPYDYRFVKWLIKEKEDSTLEAAEDILRQWNVKK
ncbi:hypothetical protein P4O66_002802 [Electrophorus voltai]|uniref:Aminotransferase class I/classII large domain-containing protein n=1 Tax=Electrophorus voltai TaxID=2609070 RepID=A0AAD8YX28_9TELE|nr:hypothetical protein P4O66_002802 [Electrophorus voltai]